jgi:hypothetical protein
MMKKGDVVVVADDDDDVVRTSASQNQATATLCADEFFLRLSLISEERCGGGQDIDSQHDTYRQSWLSFCSHSNLHIEEGGLQNLHEFYTIIL